MPIVLVVVLVIIAIANVRVAGAIIVGLGALVICNIIASIICNQPKCHDHNHNHTNDHNHDHNHTNNHNHTNDHLKSGGTNPNSTNTKNITSGT